MSGSGSGSRHWLKRILVVLGLLLATLAIALVVLVPRWVKARIIAAAAAHGVALTIDDLAIVPGRARLAGVRASPLIRTDQKGAPNVSMTAPLVDVALDGLTPVAVTVTGATIDVDGAAHDVQQALVSREQQPASQGASSIDHLMLHDCSLSWKHPLANKLVQLRAAHVELDVLRKPERALGDDWHLEVAAIHAFDAVKPPPPVAWALAADHDAGGTRGTLTLGKGAAIKASLSASGGFSFDVDTPSVGPSDVGIPVSMMGLVGDEASRLELHLHHTQGPDSAPRAEGTLVATASAVFLGPSPARTTLAVDAKYAGEASAVKLTQGTLRAGPFTGNLDGAFSLTRGDLKGSFHYLSGLMSCLDAVKAQATSYGALGAGALALAGALGLDRVVEGTVQLEGKIDVDTQAGENHAAFHTRGDCRLSYLPSL